MLIPNCLCDRPAAREVTTRNPLVACGVAGYGCVHIQPSAARPCRELVYAKFSTSRRKLSAKWCHADEMIIRTVGLWLCAPQTQRAERAAWSSSDCLGAALVLAAPASAMRDAVGRAASLSRLDAARVLAPPAPSMRFAAPLVASC